MLLTGPASDPHNIHKIIFKEGPDPAEVLDAPSGAKSDSESAGKRKSLGMENVVTKSGPVRAEHVSVSKGDRAIDMWMSEEVKPCGIVRVTSPDGELILRSQGTGGPYAKSVIGETAEDAADKQGPAAGKAKKDRAKVRVETKSSTGDQR